MTKQETRSKRSATQRSTQKTEAKQDNTGGRGVSELARKALTLGLSGLFLTEGTIRRTVGEALPRDWLDFALDQSERTRAEFLERLARELVGVIETLDLAALAERLLDGRTLEIQAQIRLRPETRKDRKQRVGVEFSVIAGNDKK